MPTYEYICEDCGREFEYFQSMTEDPKTTCAECGGKLKRLIGAGAGLIFKGSGFYITDYKGKGAEPVKSGGSSPSNSETRPTESPSKPADSKPTGGETKPAENKKTE